MKRRSMLGSLLAFVASPLSALSARKNASKPCVEHPLANRLGDGGTVSFNGKTLGTYGAVSSRTTWTDVDKEV